MLTSDLNRLRLMPRSRRREAFCSCGHAFYYHQIDSGHGECFSLRTLDSGSVTYCPCAEVTR